MQRLAQSVFEYIRKYDLLRAGERVGVAVSGGADSVALLRLLLELREHLGIVLSVVHFNHQLRGAESDGDERFVRALAIENDLPFVCESGDVKARAAEKTISVETAARELRYEFFNRVLRSGGCTKIATAHTLDDQAETVLLKLLRGAGTRGMAGIYPKVDISLGAGKPEVAVSRPLLAIRRPELEQYLRAMNQPWREDSSNADMRHTRNRIRREVLPILETQVNPRVRETLAEAGEIARAEEEYWARQNALLLPQAWTAKPAGGALDLKFIRAQPLAVQRRLLRAAAESFGLNLEFQQVGEILALDREGAEASLPGGWIVTLNKSVAVISREGLSALSYAYPMAVPDKVTVREIGLVIETEVVRTDGPHAEAVLDKKHAGTALMVRNWRQGERFWPAHSKEPKKIKELLQDRHITGDAKKLWPVIASGDEVVWVHELGVRRGLQAANGPGILIRAAQLNS